MEKHAPARPHLAETDQTCAVCGQPISDASGPSWSKTVGGWQARLCSPWCLVRFEEDPNRYTDDQESRDST